jgi:hypothetical protein
MFKKSDELQSDEEILTDMARESTSMCSSWTSEKKQKLPSTCNKAIRNISVDRSDANTDRVSHFGKDMMPWTSGHCTAKGTVEKSGRNLSAEIRASARKVVPRSSKTTVHNCQYHLKKLKRLTILLHTLRIVNDIVIIKEQLQGIVPELHLN